MAKETTFTEDKKENIGLLDIANKAEELREETVKEIEQQTQDTTKTGRKSKEAKEAENKLVVMGGLETILTGLDAIIGAKLPELKHTEEEIQTLSTLSAPVITKYFDLDAVEYKDEVKLASYFIICEMQKAKALIARLRNEAKKQAEQDKKNQADKKPKDEQR